MFYFTPQVKHFIETTLRLRARLGKGVLPAPDGRMRFRSLCTVSFIALDVYNPARMIEFDFIVDDRFRDSLMADHAEFRTSLSGEAWKTALVLVGSIVGALLVDHLVATDYRKRTGTDPLKMHLGVLIAACENDKVLSAKTAALSTVVKSYRNLIHPGRSVRLGETASKSAANVAGELLQMIVEEISANRRDKWGYTADQIVKKLERDESAMSIHKHLLKDVPEFQIECLLMKVIPKRYFELDNAMGEFGQRPTLKDRFV